MAHRKRIDLNADVGEGFGAYCLGGDEAILPFVTSANIACGFHGGDPRQMDRTVALAVRAGVAVGAHPGYPDLRGFGRRPMQVDPEDVETDVVYQVGALAAFAQSHGTRLVHVKPHGALYNQATLDLELARAIARGVARVSRDLIFVGLATSSAMRSAAEGEGLVFAAEAFADRTYCPDGALQSRKHSGAVITDPRQAAEQALRIARDGVVVAAGGATIPLQADTLCLHGDNPSAAEIAWAVRQVLDSEGVRVEALAR
jgi:UPF0271 protein